MCSFASATCLRGLAVVRDVTVDGPAQDHGRQFFAFVYTFLVSLSIFVP